ncbi:MAG: DNA ligase D [Gemmatimonadaceae bacterium]|nr:DNA ligase D [Gemmatimonadaceae bacterium]
MTTLTRRAKSARQQLAEYRRKRDFAKTAEPSGSEPTSEADRLRFVIQKHAASHLHFDLRLELDGVMKSWALPKGPSTDPSVKRLAMQVEDHPIDYNTFEGTIPEGEYGAGTVMLWDTGRYTADGVAPEEAGHTIRTGYERGELKVTFFGSRMRGSWALVRTKLSRGRVTSSKPQWLFIKRRDEYASSNDVVAENMTSVTTGRTMEEIAEGRSKVWRGNRSKNDRKSTDFASLARELEPMYASIGVAIPGDGWTFEPKYDGVRVLAFVTAGEVSLITRNGKDKAAQFPEITDALQALAKKRKKDFVLDGEIVALINGKPGRFQKLQSRMHVKGSHVIARHRSSTPAALVLFDILAAGNDILLCELWTTRRARLVKELGKHTSSQIRITESGGGNGGRMLALARKQGWEGIIAKRTDSLYEPGVRTRAWLKLKIEFRQEFVVGGFTEPRKSRQHLGALLLGCFDHNRFIYVGHAGGGFTGAGLAEMYRRLKPLEQKNSPFEETPKTNERAHWVKPKVVVEVKFNEWTSDGRLRQPIYLGIRDDKKATDVGRESTSMQNKNGRTETTIRDSAASATSKPTARRRIYAQRTVASGSPAVKAPQRSGKPIALEKILAQLDEIQSGGGDGRLEIAPHASLDVTNLDKVFFPKKKLTKGDLMRYYVTVATLILPVMKDRPLVLKRFPDGVEGPSFFQQNAGEPPEVVHTEKIHAQDGSTNVRIIGGDLATLLYTVQLGSISVDPWHSRLQSLDHADYSIIDLDPGPRAPFSRVVEVAQWAHEAMDDLGLGGAIKTSGSTGLHIYIPLPPKTPNEAATLVARIIATRVSEAHPKAATIKRSVKARGATTVYVDYLQNVTGKTVAGAYSARANPDAMVSTPLAWDELANDLDPRDFTIESAPQWFAEVGDIWSAQLKKKNSLKALV